MTYDEIKNSLDKTIVPHVSGRIIRIYDAKNPTEAQARRGIHPQDIVLQDDIGNSLTMQLLLSSQHMGRDSEGLLYHFQSTSDGKGGVDGIRVNQWTNPQGELRTKVQVGKMAHFYQIPEDAAPATEQAAPYTSTATAPERPKITVPGLVALYISIANELELQMGDSSILRRMLENAESGPLTTIFIQACNAGLHKQSAPITTNVHLVAEPLPATLTITDLAKAVIAQTIVPTERDLTPIGASWVELYDEIHLQLGCHPEQQDEAWNKIEAHLRDSGADSGNTAICKEICANFNAYKTILGI